MTAAAAAPSANGSKFVSTPSASKPMDIVSSRQPGARAELARHRRLIAACHMGLIARGR